MWMSFVDSFMTNRRDIIALAMCPSFGWLPRVGGGISTTSTLPGIFDISALVQWFMAMWSW
jgi:hypothetical protein